MLHSRRIGLESGAAQSQGGPVLPQFPGTNTSLHDLVTSGRGVDHVRDPGVPVISH